MKLPTRFADDANGAALAAQDYFAASMERLDVTSHPKLNQSWRCWNGYTDDKAIAQAAWESGWDAAIEAMAKMIACR